MLTKQYLTPLSLSFAVHAVIAVVLFAGDFSHELEKPKPSVMQVTNLPETVEPIKAVAVDKKKLEDKVNKIRRQQAADKAREQKRIKELEDRAAAAKRKRAKEQERIKALEKQRKQKEREKKQAESAAKKARAKAAEAEKVRKRKEAEKRKADKAAADAKAKRLKEEAEAKKAAELRKRREQERKRKEKEAREKAEQERLLAEQMAQEMATRQQARRQQVQSEVNRFAALIRQTIDRHFIKDRSTMEGKSCKLVITLASSGFVTNVISGSGDAIVCDAAKKAIYKAGTLPVSQDPDVYQEMKRISITFSPDF